MNNLEITITNNEEEVLNMNNEEITEEVVNEEDELLHCSECDELITGSQEYYNPDGERICESCFEDNYCYCDDCGEVIRIDESTSIDGGYKYVCENCLDDYYHCEDCGEWVSEAIYISSNGGYYVCDDCRDNGYYYYCDDCGDCFYEDDLTYCEHDDCYYCDRCIDDHQNDNIGSWHSHKGTFNEILHLEGEDINEVITYGEETETEHEYNSNENEDELIEVLSNCPLKPVFERDGSLDDSGVEIISQPFTYDYLMANVEGIKEAFTKAIALGYRSDRDDCAVHIHVKRPSDEVVDRIWLILETFKEEIIKVARRHSEGYAKFVSDNSGVDENVVKSIKYIKDNKDRNDRYYALNLENSKTIEFRIFRGTLNYRTWLAYHQFVHNIMVECSNLDKPVEDITWEDLIVGEYIEEFVEKRGIMCYKRVVDNTRRIEKTLEKRNEVMAEVNKVFKKYARQLLNNIKIDKSKFDNIEEVYDRVATLRNVNMYIITDMLERLMRYEHYIKEDGMTLEGYINEIKYFMEHVIPYHSDYMAMPEDLKDKITSIINANSDNNEDMGGEE